MTLIELFEKQVEKTPDAIAVAFDNQCLSYAELDQRASRLGHALRTLGVGSEDIVGIALPRSPELVTAMLAIWKAGAAYLPLDLNYPAERIHLMATDCAAKVIICGPEAAPLLAGLDPAPATLDPVTTDYGDTVVEPLPLTHPRNTAYIIYTSGSTGRPKGVAIEHRSVVAFLRWAETVFSLADREELFASTSVCFDLSVFELFLPLCCGGKVVLAPQNALDLYEVARRSQPTLVNTVPSAMAELLRSGRLPESVRVVNLAGEPLTPQLVAAVSAGSRARVLDLYGPSETTTYSTYAQREPNGPQVIGRPVANTRAYVLDTSLRPVPVGMTGELYLGGAGLARGYVGRARATAERFVADPWGEAGARMYRTGDLVRWRPDRNLEFVGRPDGQVKVRGFRIELGEIETALRALPGVSDAVVKADGEGDARRLLGYVLRKHDEEEEAGTQEDQLKTWQELYDRLYQQASETEGDFNVVGWESSYTGEPLPAAEMQMWVDETVVRLRSLRPHRVLEIGCGTGLLLTRLAGECERYVGMDFSGEVLQRLQQYLDTRPDLRHVELRQGMAQDLAFLEDASMDLVFLNSVVQYFPDADYLLKVIEQALRVTKPGGHVFLGDVRSLPLLHAFHTSVQLYRAEADASVEEVQRRIRQAERMEGELLVAPQMFEELGRRHPKLGRVEVSLKESGYDNELSRFRYDVTLQVGEKETVAPPDVWLNWDAAGEWRKKLVHELTANPSAAIGVRRIKDRRVSAAVDAVRCLQNAAATMKAGELARACVTEGEGPDEVAAFTKELNVSIHWQGFGPEGIYDAIFNQRWQPVESDTDLPPTFYRRFANTPASNTTDLEFAKSLRETLRQRVPDYMVPVSIQVLAAWPLTPNGKVDRKALPAPDFASVVAYRAPRTAQEEVLCGLFAEVLGLERVGIGENFFELGGHSLMATRLVSRVRAVLGIEVAVRVLFEAPTIERLAARLPQSGARRPRLEPQERPALLPLSYGQRRLWFIDRLEGSSTEYNLAEALRLSGELDQAALERAVQTIVTRHESLRTRIVEVDGEPVQLIEPEVKIELPLEDLSELAAAVREERVREALRREAEEPFDLGRGPLLRLRLLRLEEQEHVLLRSFHHVVSDGWSQGVFNRELMLLYEAYREGRESPLPQLGVQYADYALWQREWLAGGALDEGLEFWKEQLASAPEQLELPLDRPRPPLQTFAAETVHVSLPVELTAALKRLGQGQQATLYMTLLAGFAVLLSRYSGQDDIVVGSPIANRQDAQLEDLIGFFVNTLVLRVRPDATLSFTELLAQVRGTTLAAYQHQDVPFEKLVEELAPERSLNRTPLFQVLFALQNAPEVRQELAGLQVERLMYEGQTVHFDLEVHAVEQQGVLSLYWLYNRDLFDRWRIQQMAQHYRQLLETVVAQPEMALQQLSLLSEEEERKLLGDGGALVVPEQSLDQLFAAQAVERPDTVALVFGEHSLSYGELDQRSNRLARFLMTRGVGPESVVGIALPRSLELVVSILAVLKTGAAYLPLDPAYPRERLSLMLSDSGASLLIGSGGLPEAVRGSGLPLLLINEDWASVAKESNAAFASRASLNNTAYIIYTSGSTGRPKGVAIEHRSVVAFLRWAETVFSVADREELFASTSVCFDLSVFELFLPLCCGGKVVLAPQNALDLYEVARTSQPTLVNTVPSAMAELLRSGRLPESVRVVNLAGEPLTPQLVAAVSAGSRARVLDLYGPSETTTYSTYAQREPHGPQVIGRPVANTHAYVLDTSLRPVPVGVTGELYLGGAGLARGYVGRARATAERFVADPWGEAGARMYRTGDLVRWRVDGTLELHGRVDHQVKVRGFRIELGEIEAALRTMAGVSDAVVVARDGGEGAGKQLVAYVESRDEGELPEAVELRWHLQQKLPEYMVPAAVVLLDKFPLTPNGKVDRKALPAPDFASVAAYRAPRTAQEEMLCGLFAEVLGLERVGIGENFFELGGHSLMATRLVSRVRAVLGIEVAVRALFEAPTIERLAARLPQSGARRPRLEPQERPALLPLSYGQRRLWFIDRLEGSSTEYNLAEALRLSGELDQTALERAVQTIVARHESLRTRIVEVDGEPVQLIEPEVKIELPLEDLSELAAAEREERVHEALRREAEEPFDLGRGPLLRLRLLRLEEQEHVLLRSFHHVVSDGWSQGVFNRELMLLYEAYREGRESPLPQLQVQYADYALWQREWLAGGALDEGLEFWKEQLAAAPEQLELPLDRPRPPLQTFAAETVHVTLPAELTAKLKALGQGQQATLYMTLLAGFAVLLSRYSGQDDIVVGSPIANRQDAQLEELIGFFVNTLVLRVRPDATLSFTELLAQVRGTTLAAYQHQDVPFEKLVEELAPERSLNRTPLFQVLFALQNAPEVRQELAGLQVERLMYEGQTVHFDLEVHAVEQQGVLSLYWLYNRDLFDRWRMQQMAQHYRQLLETVVVQPMTALNQLSLLTVEEERRLLGDGGALVVPEQSLDQLFAAQAVERPEAVALVFGEHSLTYAELESRSNRLARFLTARGVGPESVVGIALPRSVELVVSILAVLKAGAAYLPLDPAYPRERLSLMLADSGASLLIGSTGLPEAVRGSGLPLLLINEDWASVAKESDTAFASRASLNNTAYIIYTSGSTGRPKGVAIEHRSVVAFLRWAETVFSVQDREELFASTSVCFDLSVFELFLPLCYGGKVVLAPQNALDLYEVARRSQPTLVNTVPSAMAELLRSGRLPESVRVVNLAGEPLTPQLVAAVSAGSRARVLDLYGPSETTTYSTYAQREPHGPQVIGRPVANTRAYVLDTSLRPVPVGVTGELYLGGAGLARGYVGRARATAERFVADPWGEAGARMYRTGDLVRWRVDGTLELHGRVDHQVKVRGFRIELGEIEAALRTMTGVSDAVVVARDGGEGAGKQLVAYVESRDEGELPEVVELRWYLQQKLPEYMVPAAFVLLDKFPLTPNGKVDRKALPAPDFASVAAYRAPRTAQEEVLCELFAEVLGLERVGIGENFFELGGHSLMATRLVSRVRAVLGIEVAVRALFEAPTIERLAARLPQSGARRPRLEPQERPALLPLSYGQRRLWFIDRLEGSSTEYNLAEALRLSGELDQAALKRAVQTIVARHESLRTRIVEVDGEPVQLIEPEVKIELPLEDLSELATAEREERVREALRREAEEPFDLGRGPLLRLRLLRLEEQEHVLLRSFHHVVSDGWSQGVFNRELMLLYEAYREGRESPLPQLQVQYADYALWQREWLAGGALDEGLEFWKEQLAAAPEQLELPLDRPRPPLQTFAAETVHVTLPVELTAELKRLGQGQQATLYMTLLAGFAVLLSRYSGQDDIVVGSPIANRQDAQLEELIGFFVNTLVLRVRPDATLSFAELLTQVRGTTLAAYQHQDVPFEKLVEELAPERSLNRTPLFQVLFALQNAPEVRQELAGLQVERLMYEGQTVHFDLEVHAVERQGELSLYWLYNRDLFDRWRIQQMAQHFQRLLETLTADADRPIGRVQLLSDEERREALHVSHSETQQIHTTLPEWFEQQVALNPHAIAVTSDASELTYGELNEHANRLAHYLISRGVGPEDVAALALPRSVEMVVGVLAVLKSGAAYLPLDPEYPAERLKLMIDDSATRCVLTTIEMSPGLPVDAPNVLLLDSAEMLAALRNSPKDNPIARLTPHNSAYVIYTSGSTGMPKGVLVTHQNVARLMKTTERHFTFGTEDVWTLFHSYAFDFSVWEIWGALLYGGRLVVVPYLVSRTPADFLQLLIEQRVTVLNQTPTAFYQLMQAEREGQTPHDALNLRYVIFGGEALDLSRLKDWYERHDELHPRLVNMYGITETTVHVTYSSLDAGKAVAHNSNSLIGEGLGDLRVYVLDSALEPVPTGVTGEMYVGGAGGARGYLRRPELTAQRFVADPWSEPGARMYRTGDLARRRPDGSLEFVGRGDAQVKIRGFRIEVGEIEAALREQDGVRQAVVTARSDEGVEKRLVGYVVGADLDGGTLREHLRERLPDYMVPAAILVLDKLPLTRNGKLDHEALPRPEIGMSDGEYVAPRNHTEELLCEIWSRVLGIERIGVRNNFFGLGGDSILSIRIMAEAKKAGLEFSLQQFFRQQTIEGLAQVLTIVDAQGNANKHREPFSLISEEDRLKIPEGVEDAYPTSRLQEGMLFHSEFDSSSPLYHYVSSFHLRGRLDEDLWRQVLNEVVNRHEVLRTSFDLSNYSQPLQLVHKEATIALEVEDIGHLSEQEQEAHIERWIEAQKSRGFDMTQPGLIRFRLHRRSRESFQFSKIEHHAILDGWSEALLLTEMFGRYYSHLEKEDWVSPKLASRFCDYVELEQEVLASEEARNYWREYLADVSTARMPWSRADRAEVRSSALQVDVDDELSERLKTLAQREGVSIKSVLLAAHVRVMSLLAGQSDVVTGLVVNGRVETQGGDDVLGLFLNTLPLRLNLRGGRWIDLVQQTAAAELALLPHRRFPLQELQQLADRAEFFEVAFSFTHFHVARELEKIGGFEILSDTRYGQTNFPLMAEFGLDPSLANVQLYLSYNAAIIGDDLIHRIANYYRNALKLIAEDPQGRYESVSLLPQQERQQLLEEWNTTQRTFPMSTLPQLFEAQVEKTPDATALIFQERVLSYRELNERANRVAHYLISRGVGPEDIVGLAVPRSPEMVVGLLGIMKAGAAYLPLDPEYPQERLDFMIEDSGMSFLLSTGNLSEWGAIAGESAENPTRRSDMDNIAYVIYTSGSTGRPKGVQVTHGNLVNFLRSMQAEPGLTIEDTLLAVTTLSFDIAGLELYLPLISGARVVLGSRETATDGQELLKLLRQSEATVMQATPATWRLLIDALIAEGAARVATEGHPYNHFEPRPPDCRGGPLWPPVLSLKVLCGGEALSGSLAAELRQTFDGPIYNMYGPTETTIWSALHEVNEGDAETPVVSIGRPIANTQLYLLDEALQPVPVGVSGELYIGGAGVARGYLGRPELTAERFIPDAFSADADSRLYRTGDVARYLPDGNVEYLGRADHQVKVRGFRIELGEIEAALRSQPSVKDAAVMVDGQSEARRLLGYVIAEPGETIDINTVRGELRQTLPEYMVPSSIQILAAWPLTPNGKLDRKALPAPEFVSASTYRAPRTPREEALCSLFSEVLDLERVGIDDNFFELGGHSLMAARLVSRLRSAFGVELGVRSLFDAPTVADLNELIDRPIRMDPFTIVLPMRSSGDGSPLFFIHPATGFSSVYSAFIRFIDARHPIYGLQARGLSEDAAFHDSVEEMASEYLNQIRAIQSHGPYHLLGWSFGGIVAQAIASLAQKEGEEVRLLALLDAIPARSDESLDYPEEEAVRNEIAANPDVFEMFDDAQLTRIAETIKSNMVLRHKFTPPVYSGDVLLFVAARDHDEGELVEAWRPYINGIIRSIAIDCPHLEMLQPDVVAEISRVLADELGTPHKQGKRDYTETMPDMRIATGLTSEPKRADVGD